VRCQRSDGSLRRFWFSRKDAEEFIATHPDYHGDVVTRCPSCGAFHANRPWDVSVTLDDDPLVCGICTEDVGDRDLLTMPDGLVLHEDCATRRVN
jgi:hypothetical protein